MRNSAKYAVAFFLVFLSFCNSAIAADLVWYDQEKQAIAIDTYVNGYGGSIGVDFNADHSAAGLIDQTLWHYLYGSVTQGGLYQSIVYSWGSETYYGWGERLGEYEPAYDFSSYVTDLDSGAPAPEGFHYFTPEWDVTTENTVIYVQPIVASTAVPVTEETLDSTFIRTRNGEWKQFYELAVPELDPTLVDVSISPGVLNRKSSGRWVTAQIKLPTPYNADDVDIDTVVLSISSEVIVDDALVESVELSRRVARTGKGGNKLIAKFDRQQLMDLLAAGDNTVSARGRLYDGTPIQGATTLRVIH
jgi:hypothetical protein